MRTGPLLPLLAGRDGAAWLEEEGRVWTRGQARRAVAGAARDLRAAGAGPGRRVAWLPRPRVQGIWQALAALETGAELVLLPLRETEERRALDCADLAPLLCVDGQGGVSAGARPASRDGVPGRVWLRSSGSMGQAAWLAHDLEALLRGARAACSRLGIGGGNRWWLSLPLDHVGGLGILLRGLACGCRLVLPGVGGAVPFAPGDWLSLVPAQLERLLGEGVSPVGLGGVLLGGAPLPGPLATRAVAAGWPLWVSYGATETGALVCADPWRPGGGSGRPFPPHRVELDSGQRVRVLSPCLWRARLAGKGEVRLRQHAHWTSGDLAAWQGRSLRLLGRMDRVINSGGEKIPAERVEEALAALPGVRRAVVVSWPDERFGLRPAAFVAMADGSDPDGAALGAALEGGLPRHMVPVRWLPWPGDLDMDWKLPLAILAERAALLAAGELRRPG
jgi:O-succinylbenzoic acid--CoA ligase